MDTEFSRNMLKHAWDRLENTSRWSFIFVLILLFFHITGFQPYINLNQRVSRTEMQIDQLEQLEPVITNALVTVNAQKQQIEEDIRMTLKRKQEDFRKLDRMVHSIQSSPEGTSPSFSESISLQQPQTDSDLPNLEPELVEKIRQTRDFQTQLEILSPYIRENIIQPNFEILNQHLQEKAEVIQTQTAVIEEQRRILQQLTADMEGGATLQKLVDTIWESMKEAQQAAKSIKIEPPDNDNWWRTVVSKERTLTKLGIEVTEELIPPTLEPAREQINQSFDRALTQQENIKTELDQAIKELKTSFEDQKNQLGSLGEPFRWILLDLETTVARFPILLALALATISWLGSQRLLELAYALHWQPSSEKSFWEWYFQRTGHWSQGICSKRKGHLRIDLLFMVCLIWVAISAIEIGELQQVGYIRAGVMLLLAWAIVSIAFWHRQKIWHQVRLLRSQVESLREAI